MGKVAQDLDTFRMPVEMRIETEGNPEEKKVEVAGTSSEFVVETFGKPKKSRSIRTTGCFASAILCVLPSPFAGVSSSSKWANSPKRLRNIRRRST